MTYSHHIERVEAFIQQWLTPKNRSLQRAIEQTVDENLFTFEEISFQLRALKNAVSGKSISRWAFSYRDTFSNRDAVDKQVLAIHAGNIPFAGFQDLLAISLAGLTYLGKRSKRDPWLISALSTDLANNGLLHLSSSDTELPSSLGNVTDVLFSGGTDSLEWLETELETRGTAKGGVRMLQRTTEFSVAILDKPHPATMKELVQAMALYNGRGCRSVGMVVTEIPLNEIKCELGDYFEAFWLTYPKSSDRVQEMKLNAAYERALGRSFAWLDSFLIVEGAEPSREAGVIPWVVAENERVPSVLDNYKSRIQSIYVPVSDRTVPGYEEKTELLHKAQRPEIDWRPDGVDPLAWLLEVESRS